MIGLLHPGAMGTAIGGAVVSAGHEVAWCSEGRSPASVRRATEASLTDLQSIPVLLAASETVIAVCPPIFAVALAEQVRGLAGVYVDANAISPATTERIAALVINAGARFVDAAIIGLAPAGPGQTRLYLSGIDAEMVAEYFAGTSFEARELGTG